LLYLFQDGAHLDGREAHARVDGLDEGGQFGLDRE